MECTFYWKKQGKMYANPEPKITKPDVTDNTNKALVDSLAGILFEQDQQIYDFHPVKYWWCKDQINLKLTWGEK